MRSSLFLIALALSDCASRPRRAPRARPARVTLSIVGTNDLHGRVSMLPWLAGHVNNLRRARAHDGAVLLLDGGDMFQGTVESNLNEGAAVIRAYNVMGYTAAAVGNHEFDYGPDGELTFARHGEDPRGALRARAREAHFPLLTSNIVDEASGAQPAWENIRASVMVTVAGVKVGLVGVSTESTPGTTLSPNFRGLAMRPLAASIRAQAEGLRTQGAVLVLVLAHAGGACRHFNDPNDLSSCEADEEIFAVARALPAEGPGHVDAIVAGHTHRGVAHVVNGIPVIESFANGRAFGRIDLVFDTAMGRVVDRRVHRPHDLCGRSHERNREEADAATCAPEPYEGAPVTADEAVRSAITPALDAARVVRERRLGVELSTAVRTHYSSESALTNLVADAMRVAARGSDLALMNAGGVRTDLAAGSLDYGTLYRALPFDNRLVTVRMRARELQGVLAHNAATDSGTLALSGVRATVRCDNDHVRVALARDDGRTIADDEVLSVATNDYLALGTLARRLAEPLSDDAIAGSPTLRDAIEPVLVSWSPLRGEDTRWYDPAHLRMVLPTARPVRCRR
jgi:5'-nucleotidase